MNYVSIKQTKSNPADPQPIQIHLKKRVAATHYPVATQSCPYGDNTVGLPMSVYIRSSTFRGTQSTDLGKGLISSLKSLETLHWLNWAKTKALEMVTVFLLLMNVYNREQIASTSEHSGQGKLCFLGHLCIMHSLQYFACLFPRSKTPETLVYSQSALESH